QRRPQIAIILSLLANPPGISLERGELVEQRIGPGYLLSRLGLDHRRGKMLSLVPEQGRRRRSETFRNIAERFASDERLVDRGTVRVRADGADTRHQTGPTARWNNIGPLPGPLGSRERAIIRSVVRTARLAPAGSPQIMHCA